MSRQQFRRWANALSTGFGQGFGGSAMGLAIQAQLPAQAPAVQPAPPLESIQRASRVASLTGVQA